MRRLIVLAAMWLAGLAPDVLAMVQRSPLGEALGRERMFFNLEMAVDKYLADHAEQSRIER